MKRALVIMAVVLGFATSGLAYEHGVTPYGDFCPKCTVYGTGNKPVGLATAVAAMEAYFGRKGLEIRDFRKHGRFLIGDVYRKGELVDRIIFDRKTGRIRSIY